MPQLVKESLKSKLIVCFLLVSIIPIVIIGILSFKSAKKAMIKSRLDELTSIAVLKVDKLESFFNERKGDITSAQDFYNIKRNLPIFDKLNGDKTNPEYLKAKKMLDGQLRPFQLVYGYKDLMLVNSLGKIVYGTNEQHAIVDIGRPLPDPSGKAFELGKKGIYLSEIFRDRTEPDKFEMLITGPAHDFSGEFIGVIAFEIDMGPIYEFIQDTTGLGVTGETLLGKKVGNNALFLNTLRHDVGAAMKRKVVIGSDEAIPVQEAVQGIDGAGISIDYRGKEIIAVWKHIPSLNWGLVAKIDAEDAFAPIRSYGYKIIGIAFTIAFIVAIVAYLVSKRISNPIMQLTHSTDKIANGDLTHRINIDSQSEIGLLADSFNKMTNELQISLSKKDDENWEKTGQTELNKTMRGDQNVEGLAKNVIRFLVNYLDAQIGALFLAEKGDILRLTAGYAYKKPSNMSNEVKFGEGLVGQAAIEKQRLLISDVPEDYIKVNSATGESSPSNIIVAPFLYAGKLIGVIEIASLSKFREVDIEFIDIVSENIAVAFKSTQTNEHVKKLLEETQRQSEELQSQQEELQQTNEELESQQEELRVSNEELEERTEALEKRQKEINYKNKELEKAKAITEEKARDLELAGKYKSEFLANMSHELRTPLNSLLILSQYLADNKAGNLTEKQLECANTVFSSGNDLLALINDILDLSKVEAGKMVLEVAEMNIREFAENIKQNFMPVSEQKGIHFDLDVSDELPSYIKTDRQKLQQIVKNLLANSFKFTEKGSINFKIARPQKDAKLSQASLNPENAISISVADTGIGIKNDKLKHIFEAFQQADGTTNRKYGGTGLGLSISKELAKLLGGEIHLKSEEGKGSVFTIYLPEKIAQNDEAKKVEIKNIKKSPSIDRKPRVSPSLKKDDRNKLEEQGRSLLIIDDDQKFSKIMVDLAHEKGFKALVAEDGETGLHMADEYKPSAIVLDIGLPGIDGWTVMQCLKDNPNTRHIPVHFISATDEHIDAMKMGAIGYLTKPVNLEKLNNAFKSIENIVSTKVKKLLIVEDDKIMRQFILDLMADVDIATTSVSTGKEAYDILKMETFDCMVLDIGLPDMSGSEFLEKVKNDPGMSRIPIIIYTGKDLSITEETELKKYAGSIIVKGAKSPERLLDEATLFLHQIEDNLPKEKQNMIRMIHDKDHVFKGKKILLVDDDVRNVFALSHILEERGITVIAGRNGKEGLECLEKNPDINLALMDIMMPEMDGYETIKKIRKQNQHRNLPIVALTAKAMKGDRDKCIKAGANDYLTKPVDANRLFSLLRVWLYN